MADTDVGGRSRSSLTADPRRSGQGASSTGEAPEPPTWGVGGSTDAGEIHALDKTLFIGNTSRWSMLAISTRRPSSSMRYTMR